MVSGASGGAPIAACDDVYHVNVNNPFLQHVQQPASVFFMFVSIVRAS